MGGRRIPPQLCTRCKGYKKLCGLPLCPILERFHSQVTATTRLRSLDSLDGATPPSIIVGEKGYPNITILYGIPPGVHGEQARQYHDPLGWHQRRISLTTILRLRSSTVSALLRAKATNPEELYEKELSLAAVSEKPVESEAHLEKPPTTRLRFDGLLVPQGPTAQARSVRVASNPVVNRKLDKLVWDDVKAVDAVWELYLSTGNVYLAVNALSLGLLGLRKQRRLVPTRWAITAVDDIIATRLLKNIRRYTRTINRIEVYHASYLGNHFTIILAPGAYEAEMIEIWHPLTPWTRGASEPVIYTLRETHSLRTETIDGGYMAIRLAIAEHLNQRRRQAKAIIIREVTRDYYAPVGNWHIRETSRQALRGKPVVFDNLREALDYIHQLHRLNTLRKLLESLNLTRKTLYERSLDEYL